MTHPAHVAIESNTRVAPRNRRLRRSRRQGITLLEVLLAIAILGGALAAIGELIRLGVRSAGAAQQETFAHLLCDSRMAEVAAGAVPPESVGQTACEEATDWVYTIEVTPADQTGLLQVMVLVQQDPSQYTLPRSYQLYRYIPDPAYIEELQAEQEAVY